MVWWWPGGGGSHIITRIKVFELTPKLIKYKAVRQESLARVSQRVIE